MKPKEWIFKNYPEQKEGWGMTNHGDEFMCRMMEEYANYLIKDKDGYDVVDYFDVSFDDYSFYCSRLERDNSSKDGEWLIVWKKGVGISGRIYLPFKHARTSVFQIINNFSIS